MLHNNLKPYSSSESTVIIRRNGKYHKIKYELLSKSIQMMYEYLPELIIEINDPYNDIVFEKFLGILDKMDKIFRVDPRILHIMHIWDYYPQVSLFMLVAGIIDSEFLDQVIPLIFYRIDVDTMKPFLEGTILSCLCNNQRSQPISQEKTVSIKVHQDEYRKPFAYYDNEIKKLNQKHKEEKEKLEGSYHYLKNMNDSLNKEKNSLYSSLYLVNETKLGLEKALQNVIDEKSGLEKALQNVIDEKSDLDKALQNVIDEKSDLDKALQNVIDEKSGLEKDLIFAKCEIESIKSQYKQLNKQIDRIHGENTQKDQELQKSKEEISNIMQKYNDYKSQIEKKGVLNPYGEVRSHLNANSRQSKLFEYIDKISDINEKDSNIFVFFMD